MPGRIGPDEPSRTVTECATGAARWRTACHRVRRDGGRRSRTFARWLELGLLEPLNGHVGCQRRVNAPGSHAGQPVLTDTHSAASHLFTAPVRYLQGRTVVGGFETHRAH